MPLTRKLASKSLIKQDTNQDIISTSVLNLVRDFYIGDGIQTVFSLSSSPASSVNTQVFISGVYQNKNTYIITLNTIEFDTAPPNLATIEIISGTNYAVGVPGDGTVTTSKLASQSVTTDKLADNSVTAIKLASSFSEALNPVGTILAYAGASPAPAGYLLCNGDSVPNGIGTVQGVTADFSALFALLGSTYGAPCLLPNTQGIFLRGAGSQTIGLVTYTGTRGTAQNDTFASHTHGGTTDITNSGSWNSFSGTSPSNDAGNGQNEVNGVFSVSFNHSHTFTTNATGTGTETYPANLGINYIIKY